MMKKTLLTAAILGSLTSAQAIAECAGNVYSMNAGRGHVGLLLDVQEAKQMSTQYFSDAGERVEFHSRALFSTPSMAYDRITDRLYYTNSPQPTAYHVQVPETEVTAEELKNLDLHAKTIESYQLAYMDPATGEHVAGPVVNKQILRMAFNPDSGELFASDARTIFKVDPETGETTHLGDFESGLKNGGFTNWGDFVFQDGQLLFVTNSRTFSIDTSTGAQTFEAFHFIGFVTTATLDQNGQMLVAAKNQNVSGNVNSNILYRIKPSTGEKVRVGLFPSRISAMATVISEDHTCYEKTEFKSDLTPEVTGITLGSDSVTEGSTAYFTVNFDKATSDANTALRVALKDGTANLNSDYQNTVELLFSDNSTGSATISSTLTEIGLPQGVTSVRIGVPTVNDATHESNENFTLDAWVSTDKSDLTSASVTVVDNDPAEVGIRGCSNGGWTSATNSLTWCSESDTVTWIGDYHNSTHSSRFEGTIDGLSIGSASTLNYKILSTQDIGGLSRFTVEMDYGNGWVTVGNYRSRVYSRPTTVSYTYDFTPASTQAKYRLTWNITSDRPDGGDDISIGLENVSW
ncbi:hypothetical protein BCT30_10110 [Enterovibrio norvegicus]|uniref:YncE family protein n=1 Tax=Enterovibrio norvegicus TaxID=188144 RepID=UPI000C8627F2|nr:hypothetical protein [Enterovibrio norvegicus]MCC4799193.1 hypothetical protein [Enterovibrio norvegicus]PMI34310.1 hypothetical protein BCU47_07710 [Enterovibrio norvegicus]PMI34984.1 hypothetical protein BCU46_20215 [Enterovibrio norvegicus]PMN53726.1 hypothetical protein BCT30_10110 [Enterovibrio norvegicus]TKF13252.1 hypothetical protein FCV66_14475 [Enterovibrio norvegicus]